MSTSNCSVVGVGVGWTWVWMFILETQSAAMRRAASHRHAPRRRERQSTLSRPPQHAAVEQRAHVAVHGFNVAPNSTRRFADCHGARARHGADGLPAFRGQELEQELRRREGDAGALLLAAKPS